MNSYEAPSVRELGSLAQLTQKKKASSPGNKIGSNSDIYSSSTPLIGSIVSPQ